MSAQQKKILGWVTGSLAVISSVCYGVNWWVDKISERAVFTNETKKTNQDLPKLIGKMDTLSLGLHDLRKDFNSFIEQYTKNNRIHNEDEFEYHNKVNKAVESCAQRP